MKNKKVKSSVIVVAGLLVVLLCFLIVYSVCWGTNAKIKKQLKLADKYLMELQYDEAIATYKDAIEINPKSADAYLGLSDAYCQLAEEEYNAGNVEACLEYLNNALDVLNVGLQNTNSDEIKNSIDKVNDRKAQISEEQEKKKQEEEEKIAAKMRELYTPVYDYSYVLMWTEIPTLDSLTGVSVKNKGWKCVNYIVNPMTGYDYIGNEYYSIYDYNEEGLPLSFGDSFEQFDINYTGKRIDRISHSTYDFMASFRDNTSVFSWYADLIFSQDGLVEAYEGEERDWSNPSAAGKKYNTYEIGNDGRILFAELVDREMGEEYHSTVVYSYNDKGLLQRIYDNDTGDSYEYEYKEINYLNCVTNINRTLVGKHDYTSSYSCEYDEDGCLKKMFCTYNVYDDEINESNGTILSTYTDEYSFGDYHFPENPKEGDLFSVPVVINYGETGEQTETEVKYMYSSEWK